MGMFDHSCSLRAALIGAGLRMTRSACLPAAASVADGEGGAESQTGAAAADRRAGRAAPAPPGEASPAPAAAGAPAVSTPADNPPSPAKAELGRLLFFDP